MPKNQVIEIKDEYETCIKDSCFTNKGDERRPKGHVKVYEVSPDVDLSKGNLSKKLDKSKLHGTYEAQFGDELVDDDNLIIYAGREWLASAIFGKDNSNITATFDERVYWLGIGSGGAPAGDPFNPTNPTNNDTTLDTPVMINSVDTDDADYRIAPWEEGYYKKPFESVEFEQDGSNNDKYLVAKATIIVSAADANENTLSEAGLFSASSDSGGYSGNFTLFSRVTFPGILKNATRQLVFVWYIYT